MYKKGGIIMLIGLSILLISAIILSFKYDDIKGSFTNMEQNKSKIVVLNIDPALVNTLKINTKNDKVNIIESDSDVIEVTYKESDYLKYTLEKDENTVSLVKEKEIFKIFNFDFSFFSKKVVTEIRIPKNLIKNIEIINYNSEVALENLVLDSLNVNTTNAEIELNNLNVNNSVDLITSNAKIKLNKVNSSGDYIINTTNNDVDIKELVGKSIKINTTNGKVKLDNINVTSVDAKTKNDKIILDKIIAINITAETLNDNIYCNVIGNRKDYKSKINTKNGKIIINGEKTSSVYIEENLNNTLNTINLKTSNDEIDLNFSS